MDIETALRIFAQRIGPVGADEKELRELGLFRLSLAKSSLKDGIESNSPAEGKGWNESDWEACWLILEAKE